LAREIARYHDTWILTAYEHEAAIREELANNPVEAMRFVFLDPWGWTMDRDRRYKRIPWQPPIHYYAWQLSAYLKARSLHERVRFDIIHHVTYARYYTPSFLSLLPVPFLWGPVGGGESAPRPFWRDFGGRGMAYEALRHLARWLGEFDPFVRMTARRSALARATTGETAVRLRKIGCPNVEIFPQSCLPDAEIRSIQNRAGAMQRRGDEKVFLSVARLLHWKGIHLGLRAFALARPRDTEYWIVGTGPEKSRLESLTKRLGIADRVRFMGDLSREETLGMLGSCLALVHTSLHDSGGVVCVEAMAAARPVICLAIGGPATQVTPQTGFVIPAITPEESVRGIAVAMRQLVDDDGLRAALGQNAFQHASARFSWERRGRLVSNLYEDLRSARA
jgi:glycosyltransferase involved in cell wall biosynthesis